MSAELLLDNCKLFMKKVGLIATSSSRYLRKITNTLVDNSIIPSHIFIGSKVERTRFKIASLRRIARLHGKREAIWRLHDAYGNKAHVPSHTFGKFDFATFLETYSPQVIYFDHIRSGRLLMALMQANLDLLLLCGCGIVSKQLISTVPMVMNGHPAILPSVRGVDVIEWSLIHDFPLAISVHQVTAKVDAGSIFATKKLNVNRAESYELFKVRSEVEQAEFLADTAVKYLHGNTTCRPNDLSKSTLFLAMNRKQRSLARSKYQRLTSSSKTS